MAYIAGSSLTEETAHYLPSMINPSTIFKTSFPNSSTSLICYNTARHIRYRTMSSITSAAAPAIPTSTNFHAAHSENYERLIGGSSVRIVQHLLSFLNTEPGSTSTTTLQPLDSTSYILDNACGPGIATKLIKNLIPAANIVSADLTEAMLDRVRELVEKKGWNKERESVKAMKCDVRNLNPLEDNIFTHTITCLGLQMIPQDPESASKACKELYRVLKPGGVCAVAIWAERSFPPAFQATALRIRPHDPAPEGMKIPPHWSRGSWLMSLLEDAGFGSNVEVHPFVTYNEAESLDAITDNMMLAAPMMLPGYSAEELVRARDILKEELPRLGAFKVLEDGRARLEMTALVGMAWK